MADPLIIFPSSLSPQKAIGRDTISTGSFFPSGGLIIIRFEQTCAGELLSCRYAPAFVLATRLFVSSVLLRETLRY